jgi:FixJ family two-component response regulator
VSLSPPPRIAIVEDDPEFRRGVELLLRGSGLEVLPYRSAQEYLDRPPAPAPDCVLLDLELPGPSGLDLQRHLLAGDGPPVVFLSGTADVRASIAALKSGAVDFLLKPFEPEALREALGRAVERGRRDAAARAARARARERLEALTPRERQVIEFAARDLPNKEIAALLGVSLQMVKTHRANAQQKLGVGSLLELAELLEVAGETSPSR